MIIKNLFYNLKFNKRMRSFKEILNIDEKNDTDSI